jgi:predicted SnoaL-like aldol condensation-catalyzing enzyme
LFFCSSENDQKEKNTPIFTKFLSKLYDNGEISFDIRQIRVLLQSDAYQYLNKKLENKKIGFINFFETILHYQRENSCRSLKSLCRLSIKMHIKQYPNDIKQLSLYPSINDQLLTYLTYENKYAFESSM